MTGRTLEDLVARVSANGWYMQCLFGQSIARIEIRTRMERSATKIAFVNDANRDEAIRRAHEALDQTGP